MDAQSGHGVPLTLVMKIVTARGRHGRGVPFSSAPR
jgi:hypothetical protein